MGVILLLKRAGRKRGHSTVGLPDKNIDITYLYLVHNSAPKVRYCYPINSRDAKFDIILDLCHLLILTLIVGTDDKNRNHPKSQKNR